MRKMNFVLGSFLCLSLLLPAAEIRIGQDLTGWTKNHAAGIALDPDVTVSGTPGIRLEDKAMMSRTFELDPDSVYELSFYVKGDQLSGKGNDGARIMVNGGKQWKRFTSDSKNLPERGTFDWKKGKGIIDTANLGTTVKIYLAAASAGTVWYDGLKLIKTGAKEKASSFRKAYGSTVRCALLIPQGVFGFFEPGEKVSFKILLDSPEKELEYELKVKDENGKVVQALSRRKVEDQVTLNGQPCGYYVADADFFCKGKKVYSVQSGFVSAKKIPRRDPFFQMGFGLQPDMVEGIRRIGVGTISLKLSGWNNPGAVGNPERIFNWLYNNRVKPYIDAGGFEYSANIGVSLLKNLRSPKEIKEGWPLINDALLDHYRKFLTLALNELKGKVHFWTIQQETPSNARMPKFVGTWTEAMANFVVLVRMGSRQIRKEIPDAKILIGGCNYQNTIADIERITLSDLVKEFDGYVVDAYTGNWKLNLGEPTLPEAELMSFYQAASALSDSLGKGKIIRNEELGFCINYGASFDRGLAVDQAQLTARQLIITKAGPVSGFELHTPTKLMTKDAPDQADCMTTVWKPVVFKGKCYHIPLPGGAMYVTAASQLAFARSPHYFFRESFYSCTFTRPDGSALLTLWNIHGDSELKLDLPVRTRMVNMYGRETVLNPGPQTLRIGKAPIYLTMNYPAEKLAEQIRRVLTEAVPEFKGVGYAFSENEARVFIRNLTGKTRTGELAGMGKVTLLPDRTASFTVKTSAPKCLFTADNGRKYEFEIDRKNSYPVTRVKEKVVLDGSGSWLKGLPEGILKYPEDIRPKSALQPELSYFKTDFNPNGHNVSARYWTAYDDQNFYIAAKVDDPVHLQRFVGGELWRDDCLQIVFSSADTVPKGLQSTAERQLVSPLNFGIALSAKGPMAANLVDPPKGTGSIRFNVTRKDGQTFYEAAFPFKELGGRPARFGFVIFDNNYVSRKNAPYWLEFSPGISGGADASKLKLIQYK
ncbi:MAG: hypothetical protein J5858_17465 [Lentisphaeria bacterium]|nr:hypothetical protein [Lentisphaeria bacterium]